MVALVSWTLAQQQVAQTRWNSVGEVFVAWLQSADADLIGAATAGMVPAAIEMPQDTDWLPAGSGISLDRVREHWPSFSQFLTTEYLSDDGVAPHGAPQPITEADASTDGQTDDVPFLLTAGSGDPSSTDAAITVATVMIVPETISPSDGVMAARPADEVEQIPNQPNPEIQTTDTGAVLEQARLMLINGSLDPGDDSTGDSGAHPVQQVDVVSVVDPVTNGGDNGSDTDAIIQPVVQIIRDDGGSVDDNVDTPKPVTVVPVVSNPDDGTNTDSEPSTPPRSPEPVLSAKNIVLADDYTASVTEGRVSRLSLPIENVVSLRILDMPDKGHVSVNPDNSLALVLTDAGALSALDFTIRAVLSDGTVLDQKVNLSVAAGSQDGGWGIGQHYLLETDSGGNSVIEHGNQHETIYVSASPDALGLQDIAAREGITVESMNYRWLLQHPEYGRSAGMALDQEAGLHLWKTLTENTASSHWLLLEGGYDYDGLGSMIQRNAQGESALNPLYVSSYGDKGAATLTSRLMVSGQQNQNIVFDNIAFKAGASVMRGENILFEDVLITKSGLNVQNVAGFTIRNSKIIDVIRDEPVDDAGFWSPHINRVSGFYATRTDGLLIENVLVDHTGWADDYDPSLSLNGGQAPSIYSQNIYINYINSDVTLRDNILMRGASFGAQVRSGGFIEDNVFLDNNAALNMLSGTPNKDRPTSGYSLLLGNLITSGAHKTTDSGPQGALTMGVDNSGYDSTLIGNLIAHLADPNNPEDLASKYVGHQALSGKTPYYDDTVIYNWVGGRNASKVDEINRISADLNKAILNGTTIQNFASELLGKEGASIADLADYLRNHAGSALDHLVDADVILAYFRLGFDMSHASRQSAETLRFVPTDLGEGVRWDNRLNWSTQDLPGTAQHDSVDLGGNRVQFGGTVRIDGLSFGNFGALNVEQGRLTVDGRIDTASTGAKLSIASSGQFWFDGYADNDMLRIAANGGRLANFGDVTGKVGMTVSGKAQVLLASGQGDFEVSTGGYLKIKGGEARVGFDGASGSVGVLRFGSDAKLDFSAVDANIGQISEFRSGAFGEAAANIRSGVDLGGADLVLDVSGLGGGAPYRTTLISADEIAGKFDDIEVIGLASHQTAYIGIDYERDVVVLSLQNGGPGGAVMNTYGSESSMDDALLRDALLSNAD